MNIFYDSKDSNVLRYFFDTVRVVAPFVKKKILEVINNFTIFTEGEYNNQLQERSTGL